MAQQAAPAHRLLHGPESVRVWRRTTGQDDVGQRAMEDGGRCDTRTLTKGVLSWRNRSREFYTSEAVHLWMAWEDVVREAT